MRDFAANQQRAAEDLAAVDAAIAKAREAGFVGRETLKKLALECEALDQELRSVVASKSQVPQAYLRLRDELCEFLSVPKSRVPFAAELMSVKPEEKAWEAAIERVLGGMALRLLVDEDAFKEASRFLKSRHVGLRITLLKVSGESAGAVPKGSGDLLWEKLAFHPSSRLAAWIRSKVARDYPMRCCNDLREFHKYDCALTKEGLVKRNAFTVEKDDRTLITDRARFVLGWSNHDKLEFLRSERQKLASSLQAAEKALLAQQAQLKGLEERREGLSALGRCSEFQAIDLASVETQALELKRQRSTFLGKNLKTSQLRGEIEACGKESAALRVARDKAFGELAVLTSEAARIPIDLREVAETLRTAVPSNDDHAAERCRAEVEKLVRQRKLKLDDADIRHFESYAHRLQDDIDQMRRRKAEQRQALLSGLIRKMAHFNVSYPEHATGLEASADGIGDYVLHKQKLEKEALPEHESRFRALLSKNTLNDITAFKSTLEVAFEQIEADVAHLNQSLRAIPYSDGTYVQIDLKRTRDTDVREFQNMMASAVKAHQGSDLEESFHRVKLVLDRLKKDERWCKKVTDIRTWADFFVLELDRETDEQRNVYSDSAGLSGGQKAKLAFTILGSALSYQYGLNGDKASEKSFRFVVIDEAFSKSDDKNSQYALELFKRLGLQLMVVTPSDKIHVIEPYVKRIFLTQMAGGQSESAVYGLVIDQFERAHGRKVSH